MVIFQVVSERKQLACPPSVCGIIQLCQENIQDPLKWKEEQPSLTSSSQQF